MIIDLPHRCLRNCVLVCVTVLFASPGLRSARAQEVIEVFEVEKEVKEEKKETAEAKEEADAEMPAPDNPLGAAFRKIFRPGRAGGGGIIKEEKKEALPEMTPRERSQASREMDSIDERAPHLAREGDKLLKALEKVKERRGREALEDFEGLLEAPIGATIRRANGEIVLLHEEINRGIASLPDDIKRQFRDSLHERAQRALADAQEENSFAAITEVAMRYLHTSSGAMAADSLATLHLDRQEYGPALKWMERLRDVGASVVNDPKWRLKYAYTLRMSGRKEESRKILDDLAAVLGNQGISLAGEEVAPRYWLSRQEPTMTEETPVRTEWITAGGNTTRSAVHAEGKPLLLTRWQRPVTEVQAIVRQLQDAEETLRDNGSGTAPAWQPLIVGDKIVHRDFGGVRVLDANTGDLLWRIDDPLSAERIITNRHRVEFEQYNLGNRNSRAYNPYVPGSGDRHALVSLVYRDQTYGSLGSDGEVLYVLEDHAMLSPWTSYNSYSARPNDRDALWRDWTSNGIAAYDLKTGRKRWRIGGRKTGGLLSPHLAGVYFFGVPIRSQHDLFVIGETNDQIRLYALEPETGHLKWSTLLAYPDASIDKDGMRRFWTAPVAVKQGVIVCPTSVGWLMAVDRRSQTLLWSTRYNNPEEERNGYRHRFGNNREQFAEFTSIGEQWRDMTPMIVGSRVLYPSAEEETLICLDLNTGLELWRTGRGDAGYIAGVVGNRVLAVSDSEVIAYDLRTGEHEWNQDVSSDAMDLVSGRATLNEKSIHVPVGGSRIVSLDIATGRILSEMEFASDEDRRLGNLILDGTQLLSLTPHTVTSFELQGPFERKIAERKKQNPHDAWALVMEAETYLLERKFERALDAVQAIPEDAPISEDLRTRARKLRWRVLTQLIRDDLREATSLEAVTDTDDEGEADAVLSRDAEMTLLESLAKTPQERLTVESLKIQRAIARQEFDAALDRLFGLLERGIDENLHIVGQVDRMHIQVPVWTSGQLEDLHAGSTDAVRQRIETYAAKRFGSVSEADRSRLLRTLDFTSVATEHWRSQVLSDASRGFTDAERRLLPQLNASGTGSGDGQQFEWAREQYFRLLREHDLTADQAYWQGKPTRNFSPTVPHPKNVTFDRIASGSSYSYSRNSAGTALRVGHSPLPFFQQHRFLSKGNQFEMVNTATNEREWFFIFRQHPLGNRAGHEATAIASGHRLYILNHNVLYCADPIERRVLWTRILQGRSPRNNPAGNPSDPQRLFDLELYGGMLEEHSLSERWGQNGMLVAANERAIVIYSHREIQVFDSGTGEPLWTFGNVSSNSRVFATSELLFHLDYDEETTAVYRLRDGQPVPLEEEQRELVGSGWSNMFTRALDVIGPDVVSLKVVRERRLFTRAREKLIARRMHPLTGETLWERPLPDGARFTIPRPGLLLVVDTRGQFFEFDLRANEMHRIGQIPDYQPQRQASVFLDPQRFFIRQHNGEGRSYTWDEESIDSVYLSGTLHAFDRTRRTLLWTTKINNPWLVVPLLEEAPFLIFMRRKFERPLDGLYYNKRHLTVIDKQSGQVLVDEKFPSSTSSVNSITWNRQHRFIDLMAYRQRFRLRYEQDSLAAVNPKPEGTRLPLRAPRPNETETDREPVQAQRPQPRPAAKAKRPGALFPVPKRQKNPLEADDDTFEDF